MYPQKNSCGAFDMNHSKPVCKFGRIQIFIILNLPNNEVHEAMEVCLFN